LAGVVGRDEVDVAGLVVPAGTEATGGVDAVRPEPQAAARNATATTVINTLVRLFIGPPSALRVLGGQAGILERR